LASIEHLAAEVPHKLVHTADGRSAPNHESQMLQPDAMPRIWGTGIGRRIEEQKRPRLGSRRMKRKLVVRR
jgi:hypothetical protein